MAKPKQNGPILRLVECGEEIRARHPARGHPADEVRMLYFDDVRPGAAMQRPTYLIDHDEMVEFARRWDPVPIHIDPDAAEAIGGVTASGTYVLAVKSQLLHQLPETFAIFGSAGYDEVHFHEPVRAGDAVHVVME